MSQKIPLSGAGWSFRGYVGEDWRWRNAQQPGSRDQARSWLPATVPGSVLNDLWAQGEIPDPYFERNSLLSEWVCQRTWLYRKTFRVKPSWEEQNVRLVFKGVDYEAEFFLNGEYLGAHCGMYTPVEFDVTRCLKFDAENLLVVAIAEAPHEQPQIGRSSRVRTHKARMNYWWDFSPRMVHQGIWDEVYLDACGPTRLTDVFIQPRLDKDTARAQLKAYIAIHSTLTGLVAAHVKILENGRLLTEKVIQQSIPIGASTLETDLDLEDPHLWWPNGLGQQPLYQAQVSVSAAGDLTFSPSDQREITFGIRDIQFVGNEGASAGAKAYTLQVNGQHTYIKGWNWVPIDTQYGPERPKKLEHLLGLARDANVNLLRVWGGGLIEKEAFYDLCDRLGILVWQEFIQSSSGVDNEPPSDPDFIHFMVEEARQIIPGRRNHPSLALWCGGNELYSATRPLDDDHPMLAALKAVVQELDPGRYWLPTSASGPTISNSLDTIEKDPTSLHDVHGPWEFQGLEKQYTLYNRGASLYHSEFGVEGITNLRTLNAVIAREHQWPVTLDNPYFFHAGAWWVWPQVWSEAFGGEFKDIEEEVRLVQFLQFEGLRYAVEADRRRWPHNSGTSPWQFNEPFPNAACTSAVDYYGEPKPVYYAVCVAYRPLVVTAHYPRLAWKGHDRFEAEIWAGQDGTAALPQARLVYHLLSLDGKVCLGKEVPAVMPANRSTRLAEVAIPLADLPAEVFMLDLSLQDPDGHVQAANRYLFSQGESLMPLCSLQPTILDVRVERGSRRGLEVENRGSTAALYVWLEADRDLKQPGWARFSENYFCLLPGEKKTISVMWDNLTPSDRRLTVQAWNTQKIFVSS